MLLVPQVHIGFSNTSSKRRTIVSFYFDFGPIVAADPLSKGGNYGVLGMKVGGVF